MNHCPFCDAYIGITEPNYTDYWARTGRRYVPAAATNVAHTIARAARELRYPGEDPLDPDTWPEHLQPPEPLSLMHKRSTPKGT